jgi:uncharacterized protein YciI
MSQKQWMYVLRLVRPEALSQGLTEQEQAAAQRHAAYMTKLAEEGTLIVAGRTQTTDPETMGVAIFFADDEAAARNVMENDPGITGGLQCGELFPYEVAFGSIEAATRAIRSST